MSGKAEWRDHNWETSPHPERQSDYELYQELALPGGDVIAKIEQFASNPRCFYGTVQGDRTGCMLSLDFVRQWCETKSGNKVN